MLLRTNSIESFRQIQLKARSGLTRGCAPGRAAAIADQIRQSDAVAGIADKVQAGYCRHSLLQLCNAPNVAHGILGKGARPAADELEAGLRERPKNAA